LSIYNLKETGDILPVEKAVLYLKVSVISFLLALSSLLVVFPFPS